MDIFKALANENRSTIINSLHQTDKQSIKQLSANSVVTRQAITKHLNSLLKAKVINAEYVGKERLHSISPKAAQRVSDWLEPYSADWETPLQKLQDHLGGK
jgi:DNA-binding transcriptional ArsR family regulator